MSRRKTKKKSPYAHPSPVNSNSVDPQSPSAACWRHNPDVFWGRKTALNPFFLRIHQCFLHTSRPGPRQNKRVASTEPNVCASVTQAVSAISYQRRRNLAMFPWLHNEDRGDVQDRLRVPGRCSAKAEATVLQRLKWHYIKHERGDILHTFFCIFKELINIYNICCANVLKKHLIYRMDQLERIDVSIQC